MSAWSLPPLTLTAWLRYDLVRRLLREELAPVARILEVGAGEGALGARLAAAGYDYLGLEPDPASFGRARARLAGVGAGEVLPARLEDVDPSRSGFDVVAAFEVLEHIEDDAAALEAWRARLRPGGHVLLSVPAFADRFGPWDVLAGHVRRYERTDLAAVLERAGFEAPVVLAYGFLLGHALDRLRHWRAAVGALGRGGSLEERTAGSGRLLQPPEWSGALTRLATAPFRRLQRPLVDRDIGVGWVAYARNPWPGATAAARRPGGP